MKIAIIGLGVVGRAQIKLFAGHEIVGYDPAYHAMYPSATISDCDVAVVAVGTPSHEDGTADLDALHDAIGRLRRSQAVMIRSTVPPGTTGQIAAMRSGPTVHVPEFLQERRGGAWAESADVPYVILGGQPAHRDAVRGLLREVYPHRLDVGRAERVFECSAEEAEMAKYVLNLYWATRVTFVNEMAGICAQLGIDWETVREAWTRDPRVNPAYTTMRGFEPGFGGRCWPKDLSGMISEAERMGYFPEFLLAVQEANTRFTQ